MKFYIKHLSFILILIFSNQLKSECILGELRPYISTQPDKSLFPASGWMLPISSYPNLYALLGNRYGGDGHATFALPDVDSSFLNSADETVKMGICIDGYWPTITCLPDRIYYIAGNRYPVGLYYSDGEIVPEHGGWESRRKPIEVKQLTALPVLQDIMPQRGPAIRPMICLDQ